MVQFDGSQMNPIEYKNIYDNENDHFFYVSTHRLVLSLIEKYFKRRGKLRILDAGCGTGGLMKKLSKIGDVIGVDFSPQAIKYARKRGLIVSRASIEHLPFKNNSFDLVTIIDVIYHKQVKDDLKALKEIGRVLKPGGLLILRVPANKFLMSIHDKYVHTVRRYSKEELEEKIRTAGLTVKRITYIHSPIMPVSLVKIFLEKLLKKDNVSSVGPVSPPVNRFFTWLLNFEARLVVVGLSIPFGQGLVVVATR